MFVDVVESFEPGEKVAESTRDLVSSVDGDMLFSFGVSSEVVPTRLWFNAVRLCFLVAALTLDSELRALMILLASDSGFFSVKVGPSSSS